MFRNGFPIDDEGDVQDARGNAKLGDEPEQFRLRYREVSFERRRNGLVYLGEPVIEHLVLHQIMFNIQYRTGTDVSIYRFANAFLLDFFLRKGTLGRIHDDWTEYSSAFPANMDAAILNYVRLITTIIIWCILFKSWFYDP